MKYYFLFVSFTVLVIFSKQSYGQVIERHELYKKIEFGKELMTLGYYDSAQSNFMFAIQHLEQIPSELAYFFGRNSFHLKKYKQSINWINKYIQLKGVQGKYYEPALKYLKYAEDEYIKIQRDLFVNTKNTLEYSEYDCGGLSKMLCPVCHGAGVIVTSGVFEDIYKTCPYSLGEGFLTCEEYNLFMRGKLDTKLK